MPKQQNRSERPTLWIIAGPNGSGKSSLYRQSDIAGWSGAVWIINPDLLTISISERETPAAAAANLAAVQRIEVWRHASLDVYQTIGVETVLSSPKYRTLVDRAHARGFEVRMLFVLLDDVRLQIERVHIRVSNGGHDVPEDKIRSRRTRSFEQLAWFVDHVDKLFIFDNSSGAPTLISERLDGKPMRWLQPPAKLLRRELDAAGLAAHLPPLRRSAKRRA